jgi:hydrogenase maturation factor
MKTSLFAIGLTTLAAATCCGTATAAQHELASITVQSRQIDCTPPSASAMCSALHAQIRSHFNLREIGMLFGARTSYPEAQTSYLRVHERYQTLVREVAVVYGASDVEVASR